MSTIQTLDTQQIIKAAKTLLPVIQQAANTVSRAVANPPSTTSSLIANMNNINKENLAKSLGAPGNSGGALPVTLPQIVGPAKDTSLKSVKVVPGGNKLNLKASLAQQTGRGQQPPSSNDQVSMDIDESSDEKIIPAK